MRAFSHPRPHWLLLALPLVALALGCGQSEPIQSYTVPKEVAHPAAARQPVEVGEPTDRMLASILPAGDQAWFFKVVGPLDAIEARAAELAEFFASIRLTDDERPQWELPAEWKEEQGTGMRAATIWIPADKEPLELTVIGLPWRGTAEELLSNINRWRDQMRLPPVGQDKLGEFTRQIQVGEATMTIVDLRGRFDAGSAMPPFAGGAVGAASRAAPDSNSELPPGHPPIDRTGAARGAPATHADAPRLEAPESWRQLPAEGMRKAAFQIGDEQQGALVTVIDFPTAAGPSIADPLHNLNRWRHNELGLNEISKDELEEHVETIKIDGRPAIYARIIPDPAKPQESHVDRATLAAMVTAGERVWFFKITGDRELVADQQDEFRSFLKSARFSADEGAPDGNR